VLQLLRRQPPVLCEDEDGGAEALQHAVGEVGCDAGAQEAFAVHGLAGKGLCQQHLAVDALEVCRQEHVPQAIDQAPADALVILVEGLRVEEAEDVDPGKP